MTDQTDKTGETDKEISFDEADLQKLRERGVTFDEVRDEDGDVTGFMLGLPVEGIGELLMRKLAESKAMDLLRLAIIARASEFDDDGEEIMTSLENVNEDEMALFEAIAAAGQGGPEFVSRVLGWVVIHFAEYIREYHDSDSEKNYWETALATKTPVGEPS